MHEPSPDAPITDAEQATMALSNLMTAVSAAFATTGQFEALRTMLDGFEYLNAGTLPPGPMADLVQASIKTNRDELVRHEALTGRRT